MISSEYHHTNYDTSSGRDTRYQIADIPSDEVAQRRLVLEKEKNNGCVQIV